MHTDGWLPKRCEPAVLNIASVIVSESVLSEFYELEVQKEMYKQEMNLAWFADAIYLMEPEA